MGASYLEHDHRVAADNNHPDADLLPARPLFQRLVEDDVQVHLRTLAWFTSIRMQGYTYIVATENAHDFATAIQLDEHALLEVLLEVRKL
jgi:muramidase (phage lysozyme)